MERRFGDHETAPPDVAITQTAGNRFPSVVSRFARVDTDLGIRSRHSAGMEAYMKGMVFTEFVDMVESRFGVRTVDQMVEVSEVPSKGAYAATGTYPHTELVAMVGALSRITGASVPDLVHAYGKHLFGRLAAAFPQYLSRSTTAFEFISSIDGYIHVEVRKIYPEAELPKFVSRVSADGQVLELEYRSPRRFDALAHGLLEGALEHFKEAADVERRALPEDDDGSSFVIRRKRSA